jgi:flagellar basal-body rod protein FlgB
MSEPIASVTVELVRRALDAAILRHQAIATNIANANIPGYRSQQVDFEAQLEAARFQLRDGQPLTAASLAGLGARLAPAPAGPVALDLETAALTENTLRYQTLLKVLGKQLSITSAAINQGKR